MKNIFLIFTGTDLMTLNSVFIVVNYIEILLVLFENFVKSTYLSQIYAILVQVKICFHCRVKLRNITVELHVYSFKGAFDSLLSSYLQYI